eukprot:CAMPEP_0198424160 /NCGR_PEP_ID=MMETSP1452-20131203/3645_1 /TAXON_ID=1181717 /ORGANISM="Synchroma pusillum, Strain CCMP3072" /LENGTH=50 /DNA_ID=CAMNT_0044144485 /DNA_START=1 /DNA_END=150 /DNA_ORIENTATION=+
MLVEQLELEEADAREVATALATRAEEKARVEAMTDFLRGLCGDLSSAQAR